MTRPCMSDFDAELWQLHHGDEEPCWVCPLGFALEMRAIDRCNGDPGMPRVALCSRGHEMKATNITWLSNGDGTSRRACRECRRRYSETARRKAGAAPRHAVPA